MTLNSSGKDSTKRGTVAGGRDQQLPKGGVHDCQSIDKIQTDFQPQGERLPTLKPRN